MIGFGVARKLFPPGPFLGAETALPCVEFGHRGCGALAVLRDRPIPVVIAERALPCGDCRDLFAALQVLPHHPRLVVTSRLADEYLWVEVLNLGGHDVLAKPFRAAEVQWVLESGWRIWANNNKRPLNASEAVMKSVRNEAAGIARTGCSIAH